MSRTPIREHAPPRAGHLLDRSHERPLRRGADIARSGRGNLEAAPLLSAGRTRAILLACAMSGPDGTHVDTAAEGFPHPGEGVVGVVGQLLALEREGVHARRVSVDTEVSAECRRHLGIDADTACVHTFTFKSQKLTYYSDNAFTRMREALSGGIDMGAIWATHGAGKKNGSRPPCTQKGCSLQVAAS